MYEMVIMDLVDFYRVFKFAPDHEHMDMLTQIQRLPPGMQDRDDARGTSKGLSVIGFMQHKCIFRVSSWIAVTLIN